MRKRASPEKIDHDRNNNDTEGPGCGLDDMTFMLGKSLDGFPDYDAGEKKQQSCFGQRRNGLYLPVPVMVFFIRWLAGDTDSDIGHHGGAEINKRMASLRQDRQRTGGKADDCF